MKNFLLIILGAIFAAALIFVGWLLGARTHFMTEAFSLTMVDKSLTDLTMKELMLSELQEGKIEDAKNSLRLDIDANILTVDALRDDIDSRNQELFRKVLIRIAQDRQKFTNNLVQMDSDVEAKINSILKQATESQTNK